MSSIMETVAKIRRIRSNISHWLAATNLSKTAKISGIIFGVICSNFTDRTLMSNFLIVIGTMWTWIIAYTVKKFSNFKDSYHLIDFFYHSLVSLTFISICNVPLLLLKNEIFDNTKFPWNLVWLTATLVIVFLMSAALVLLYHKIEYKAQLQKAQSTNKKIS